MISPNSTYKSKKENKSKFLNCSQTVLQKVTNLYDIVRAQRLFKCTEYVAGLDEKASCHLWKGNVVSNPLSASISHCNSRGQNTPKSTLFLTQEIVLVSHRALLLKPRRAEALVCSTKKKQRLTAKMRFHCT